MIVLVRPTCYLPLHIIINAKGTCLSHTPVSILKRYISYIIYDRYWKLGVKLSKLINSTKLGLNILKFTVRKTMKFVDHIDISDVVNIFKNHI